jgi:hypothetical protein
LQRREIGTGKLDIGLRQGKVLCGMKHDERLDFLADGLPIILNSARGFWAASQEIKAMSREATVLENHAEEEASKILILMDIVRCPKKLSSSKIGHMVNVFYSHLAKLIYAKAASWKPKDITQLREYVDHTRRAHYLEGDIGGYIMPNWELFNREASLYADIEAYEDEERGWNTPSGGNTSLPSFKPSALAVAESLAALGVFRGEGMRATADIWGEIEFKDSQGFEESRHLTQRLIARIIEERLATEVVDKTHVD